MKVAGSGTLVAGESFDPTRLEKETVVAGCIDPMQLEVLGDGQLLSSERAGAIRKVRFSRIVYRRGNRAPKAGLTASKLTGRAPLQVQFDASSSSDPEGDPLSFRWELNGRALDTRNRTVDITLEERGSHRIRMTATDSSGIADSREIVIQAAKIVSGGTGVWGHKPLTAPPVS